VYPKRQKAGPRQGWLKELKDQVVDLKQQLAVAQQAAHKTVIHIAPSPSGTTIIGQREAHLLQEFLSKGNALITVVPSQTAEEFVQRNTTYQQDDSAFHIAAKQAVLNAVLALSGLQQLPLVITSQSENEEANRVAIEMLQRIGNPRQLVYKASHPYFERAKDALKECFSLPCLETTSALLALSQCSQILDDATSAYLYSNMALCTCDLAGHEIPEEIRISCQFLKQIRSLPQPLPESFSSKPRTRFLAIMGRIMAVSRTSHTTSLWKLKQQVAADPAAGDFTEIFQQLNEAEVLCQSPDLPESALLWVVCLRGRFNHMHGFLTEDFDGRRMIADLHKVAQIAAQNVHTMQDPFSLYAVYSISLSLVQYAAPLDVCPISLLIKLLRAMGLVWPLADTLLRYVDCGGFIDEGPLASLQALGALGITSVSCKPKPNGTSQQSYEEACQAVLQGMPPPKCEDAPKFVPADSTMGSFFSIFSCCGDERQDQMPASPLQGPSMTNTSAANSSMIPAIFNKWPDPAGAEVASMGAILEGKVAEQAALTEAEITAVPAIAQITDSAEVARRALRAKPEDSGPVEETILKRKFKETSLSPTTSRSSDGARLAPVHTKEEFGAPVFSAEQEGILDELICGIVGNQELDLDVLIDEINAEEVWRTGQDTRKSGTCMPECK